MCKHGAFGSGRAARPPCVGKHERASAPMHRTRCIGADARYRIRELFHKLFGAFHALGEVTASCPWPGGRKPGG